MSASALVLGDAKLPEEAAEHAHVLLARAVNLATGETPDLADKAKNLADGAPRASKRGAAALAAFEAAMETLARLGSSAYPSTPSSLD